VFSGAETEPRKRLFQFLRERYAAVHEDEPNFELVRKAFRVLPVAMALRSRA
jgi:hypothetical protein